MLGGQAAARAAAEGRVVGNGGVNTAGGVVTARDHEAFFARLESLVELALDAKLGPDDDVTEVCVCVEGSRACVHVHVR